MKSAPAKPAAKPAAKPPAMPARPSPAPGQAPPVTPAPPAGRRAAKLPFWIAKPLEKMNKAEWESLCDGCGRCCLLKLEDEDTGQIHHTDIACTLFDSATCRCRDYRNRAKKVPDCVTLTPHEVRTLKWLPPTCAYRLVAEGRDLYDWHPLKSGDPESVHRAGISVQGRVHCSEDELPFDRWPSRIRKWPGKMAGQWPGKAKR